jgi:hypothetical protein
MGFEDEKKNLEVIKGFLDKLDVPNEMKKLAEGSAEEFPAIGCTFRYDNLDFDVIVYNLGKWIHVKCLVLETESLAPEVLLRIYKTSLELNYELPETTFSAYGENLYVEIDCLTDSDFDDFESEFNSIAEGIIAFVKKAEKIKEISIKSTKGKTLEKK